MPGLYRDIREVVAMLIAQAYEIKFHGKIIPHDAPSY